MAFDKHQQAQASLYKKRTDSPYGAGSGSMEAKSKVGVLKAVNYKLDVVEKEFRKLNDKEAMAKKERARKLTMDAYNRANNMGYKDIGKEKLDITKPQKQG